MYILKIVCGLFSNYLDYSSINFPEVFMRSRRIDVNVCNFLIYNVYDNYYVHNLATLISCAHVSLKGNTENVKFYFN